MATTKEIKSRIKSVKDTQKITNAMYLIASTKMRKAKKDLEATRPYFDHLQEEIKRIFRTATEVSGKYFYDEESEKYLKGSDAYLIITADKGLAGAYNQNVIKEVLKIVKHPEDAKFYVVGEYGRHFFEAHNIHVEETFLYTAQNPTLDRARDMAEILIRGFENGEIKKVSVIYTDFKGGMSGEETCVKELLPFSKEDFLTENHEEIKDPYFEFEPSAEAVLDAIVPSYFTGFIYSALVDSFCSEQDSRTTAMDSANRNAEELLEDLSLEYNHVRQGAITQEITEISSGARGQAKNIEKRIKKKKELEALRQEEAENGNEIEKEVQS